MKKKFDEEYDEEVEDTLYEDEQDNVKKSSGLAGLLLLLGWLFFILFAVVFYFYFMKDLPFLNTKDKTTTESSETSTVEEQNSTTFDADRTAEVTSLITNYYSAYVACDQTKLQEAVTNPEKFDDMTACKEQNKYIIGHYNVVCSIYPGATEDALVVYAVSNLMLPNIASTPLDIQTFYVRNVNGVYIIDNSDLDETVTNYISSITATEDVQNLYITVNDSINDCIAADSAFADFYYNLNAVQ